MGAVGDIIRVTHVYEVLGVQCRNVFFYEIDMSSTGLLDASEISNVFATEIAPEYAVFLDSDNEHKQVIVDNLTDGVDFHVRSTDIQGTVSGEGLASLIALNVTLPRVSKVTRNGSKRFSGFGENAIEEQDFVLPGTYTTAITNICLNYHSFVDYDGNGNDLNLAGVIVGRTKNASGVYELDLSKINRYGTPLINTKVTTQRTRKV